MEPMPSSITVTISSCGHIVRSFVKGERAWREIIWKAISCPNVNSPFITICPPYHRIAIEIPVSTIPPKPLISKENLVRSKFKRT